MGSYHTGRQLPGEIGALTGALTVDASGSVVCMNDLDLAV